MARIVRFAELGGPEVLRLEEAPVAEPRAGEVRLRVHAIGLNRAEALFRRSMYVQTPVLPSRIGYEASGVLEAVGPGVKGLAVGDRVSTIPAFSMSEHGVYGEVAVVPASAIAPWPEGLGASEAASVWMAFLTAWGGLLGHGPLRRGGHVLITAATSSVGLAAIQIAKAEGATALASTRSPAKADALRRAGADHVIVTSREDLPSRVTEITSGRGADLIFDSIAGAGVQTLANVAGAGGRVVIYGYFGGIECPLPLIAMFSKGLELSAFSILRLVVDEPRLERGKRYVLDGLKSGALATVLDRTFSLEEVVAAHHYLEGSEQVGKIVIRVASR